MSYWPDEGTRYHGPSSSSPLSPQTQDDRSQSSTIISPSTVSPPPIPPIPPIPHIPPIPPRQLGVAYQPVPVGHPTFADAPGRTAGSPPVASSGGLHYYSPDPNSFNTPLYNTYPTSPTADSFSAQIQHQAPGYTGVTNFPLGVNIHSSPPLSFRSGSAAASPQSSPDSAVRPGIGVFPVASQQGALANGISAHAYMGEHAGGVYATQDVSISRHYRQRPEGTFSPTPDIISNLAVIDDSNVVHQDARSSDITAMHETFQGMRLVNSNEQAPVSSAGVSISQHPPYPPPAVVPPPAVAGRGSAPFSGHKVSNTPRAHARWKTPWRSHRGPKQCMSTYVVFPADWYVHPRTPEYEICGNCYDNHIRDSRFAAEFTGGLRDDGVPRRCRFSTPRMRDTLFQSALATGSLIDVVQHMSIRVSIPDCVAQIGVKGGTGIKWYRARNNDIPVMAVCQACYEDEILVYPEFGEEHFEPNPIEHPPDQTWTCDMAIPYVSREYQLRAETDNWEAFMREAPARINLRHCPGEKPVYPSGKWFTPVDGPVGFLICVTCYCDYFLLTGEEAKWKNVENVVDIFGVSVSCSLSPFNMKALVARLLDTREYTLFWKAVDIMGGEPVCKPAAAGGRMQNATWFTLHSNPPGFAVCRTCYATIAEPMGIAKHFMLKPGVLPGGGASFTCSFNPGIPRFSSYMTNLLELVYKQDPSALDKFVRTYAFIPVCQRDKYVENARWYGWSECFICPECHVDFVRGTSLEDAMPHRGIVVTGSAMCEMYSPRMRNLYLAACASDPPDPTPLLKYSLQRRSVFSETMPRARQIVNEIKLMSGDVDKEEDMANVGAIFHDFWGPSSSNNNLTSWQSLQYGGYPNNVKNAPGGIEAGIHGTPAHLAAQLEARWRAVE
ncbi:hypothetical protein F5Y17DRAFT_52512 [Xylariaceae sp. FL0594]|nr:hypothetical protein F5Y17DRAFT_52512 [Xylariaceae sp. FL0594]